MVENNQPVFMKEKKNELRTQEKKLERGNKQHHHLQGKKKKVLYEFRSFSKNDRELHCVYSVTAQDVMKLHCRVL